MVLTKDETLYVTELIANDLERGSAAYTEKEIDWRTKCRQRLIRYGE